MLTNTARASIVQRIAEDMDNGQWGTGTTLWNQTDTSLQSAIVETKDTLDVKKYSKNVITTVLTTKTSEANNSYTFAEYTVRGNTDSIIYNRINYEGFLKTSRYQTDAITTFTVRLVD